MTEHARRKSTPIPDEPRPKKKSVKKHVRSDHKHDYETVAVDTGTFYRDLRGKHRIVTICERCRICGRVGRHLQRAENAPDGMRLFIADGMFLVPEQLPEEMEVK